MGLAPGATELTEGQVGVVLHELQPTIERAHSEGWQKCESERTEIERLLEQHVRLSKVRRLLTGAASSFRIRRCMDERADPG